MSENDLRNEILQSTQRLMNQIDQIKPIEINPEEIEKSQAFINKIESEQIHNIEKSHSLLRDVTVWGDKRKDQYDEFEKPLLKTVEKSVHVSEEAAKSAIPLLQEKIDNYDRRIVDLKSSIASMGDAISKTAKEMVKNGNNPSSRSEDSITFFQFSTPSNILSNQNDNSDNGKFQQNTNEASFDNDTSYDIIQSHKLREEHLLNVVKSLSIELKALKSTFKTEQSMSKNFQYELEYIKKHKYSPTLEIDSKNINQYEEYQNQKLQISSNFNNTYYEIPLIIIEHKNQNLDTKDFEEKGEQIHELPQKIIMYQNFEVLDLDPNQNYDFLKNRIINEIQEEYHNDLKDQSIQRDDEINNSISTINYRKDIESFEIFDFEMNFNKNEGEVTITKEEGSDHHIFNYSENMNSDQVVDDLDKLINFHRSCTNDEDANNSESDEEDEKFISNENDIKLQQIKLITDFKHAANIIYNTKTGRREIITENNIRLELIPTNDNENTFYFISKNGQHLNVILTGHNDASNNVDVKLSNNEIIDDRAMFIANEKNENGEEIKLQVIVNKDGESYVTNNELESENDKINSSIFIDSNGHTFIYDSSNSVKIPVFMNETGQIMYETSNNEFIQVAMMNLQGELYYINENGEKMVIQINENGDFYALSNSGKIIPINLFKNLNNNDQIKSEIKNEEFNTSNQLEINQTTTLNDNESNYQYKGSNDISDERLVPVSISKKDNEIKIIYKDKDDAVVVNTGISHTTHDGQIILRSNANSVINKTQNSNLNLAVNGVKFNFNNDDHPETRVTRIVGGFNKSFMRRSKRKKFNWTIRPARQIVKLNIEPRPPRCFYHQSYRDRLAAQLLNNNKNSNSNQNGFNYQANSTNEANKNIPLRWMALPIRPPPPCCRKGTHNDLCLLSNTSFTLSKDPPVTAPANNSTREKGVNSSVNQQRVDNFCNKAKYLFNKRKIVQPESKFNKEKMTQEQNKYKHKQIEREFNVNIRNQKYTASPSPRRQFYLHKMKPLNPLTPSSPKDLSVQPAPRIKFNMEKGCNENDNNISSNTKNQDNSNVPTIDIYQF